MVTQLTIADTLIAHTVILLAHTCRTNGHSNACISASLILLATKSGKQRRTASLCTTVPTFESGHCRHSVAGRSYLSNRPLRHTFAGSASSRTFAARLIILFSHLEPCFRYYNCYGPPMGSAIHESFLPRWAFPDTQTGGHGTGPQKARCMPPLLAIACLPRACPIIHANWTGAAHDLRCANKLH